VVTAFGPTDFPAGVDPLTGITVSDPALLQRRPVAVKVQMFPRGQRPPWGVSAADIVYDYYQNFGLTRFHAIFYGQNAAQVGPVRSARLLDIDLVRMYQSIFAFGSAEQRTYSRLANAEFAPRLVMEGGGNCPPLCRVDPNGANLLVANTAELTAYISGKGVDQTPPPLEGMRFDPATPANGQAINSIQVRFSISAYNYWDYDPASGRYLRRQDTQEAPDAASETLAPLIDQATQAQIAADNVVVIIAPHQMAFGTHPGISEVVDIVLSGSGPGYAFRDGQVYQVVWNRAAPDSILTITYPDGSVYPFKPGNTWFEVVGKSSQIDTSQPETLRFQHALP
jgi:hypothetical protein